MRASTTSLPDVPFTSAWAEDHGISRARLRAAVASGLVDHPFRGVYARTGLLDDLGARAHCLGLLVPEHQVICDRTAAWLHGIDAFALGELAIMPAVEVCARRGSRATRLSGTDGRTRDLADTDLMRIGAICVTSPLRTALDLGCHLRRREAMAALDAFAHHHAVSSAALVHHLPRFKGRRGVVQLRELAPLVDPRAESPRESWTRLAILDAGLPAPDLQVWIEVDGVRMWRLDHAYERSKVAVEYDGWEFHERTQEQRDNDRQRRAWLRAHGWIIIIVRRGDFAPERLDRWLRELREALASGYSTRRW